MGSNYLMGTSVPVIAQFAQNYAAGNYFWKGCWLTVVSNEL